MKAFVGGNKKVIASSYLNCDQLNKKSFAFSASSSTTTKKHYYSLDFIVYYVAQKKNISWMENYTR